MKPVQIEILLGGNLPQRLNEAERNIERLRRGANRVTKEMSDTDRMAQKLNGTVTKLVSAFAVKQLVSAIAKTRGEFQQLEVAFTTMLGSAEKANALMSQLTKTAATTPFGLEEVSKGAKQLLAYGFEAEKVNETLIRLGDIAAGLSVPLNDLVYLYGTTMAQGRLYTQDLNQFTGRGIPMIAELAKQFGVAESKVKELVEAGKVGFPEVQKVIESLTDEGGKFGGLMEAQSKTITGQISNIEDAISMMFNEIGQQSEGIINETLSGVSYIIEHYERFGRILLGLVATYGVYRTAVMAVVAMKGWATAAEALHYNWLLLVEKAQKMLNATMMANPYVLVATLLAGVCVALLSMKTETERMKEAEEDYEKQKQKTIEAEEEHRRKIEELCSIAGDEAISTDTRREALNKLEQKYPDIFAKYDTEYEKLKNIKKIKEEIAALDGQNSMANPETELADVEAKITRMQTVGGWGYYKAGAWNREKKAFDAIPVYTPEYQVLLNRRGQLKTQIHKDRANAYFENLTGISNDTLEAEIKRRRDLLAKMSVGGYTHGKITLAAENLNGTFSRDELQYQLNKLTSEQNRRNLPVDSPADWAKEARKKYQAALKAYNDFLADTSQSLNKEEFEKKAKELKDAVDVAKKEYDKAKPSTDSDAEKESKAAEKARREAEKRAEIKRKLGQELIAVEQENDEAETELMEEGIVKRLKLIDDEYQKRKKAIAKQKSDWQVENEKAGLGRDLTAEQSVALDDATTLNERKRKKDTERLYKELTDEYQSYTDKRLEIERKHNDDIAALEKARRQAVQDGDSTAVARIDRSIAEAVKSKGRALMSHDLEVLRQSPEYVRAFEDLGDTSSETLQSLLNQLERLKGTAASVLNPQDLREYTTTIQEIMAELDSRDPFGALTRRAEELGEAQRELAAAKKQLDIVTNGGKIFTGLKSEGVDANGKPVIVATYLSMSEALAKYTEAKDKHTKASNRYVKAEQEARENVSRLSDAIKDLGNAIGGEAGEVIGLIMDVGLFIADTIDGIATVQKVGVEAVSAVEKASIILTIISTAVQLLQKISELGSNKAFKEYEAYAEKINEINALTDSVNQYRLAVMEARHEEDTWFAEDSLKNLRQWREYHDEVYCAYVEKAAEAQAIYQNQRGGGWLTGALNWIMGNLSILSWWGEWRDLWGQGDYKEGTTAAINNLRIETRKKSSGFLGTGIGGHSQKTEDLVSWARNNGLGELFDERGLIDKELAQSIIDNYGNKLVGQTRETLEALIELREKYDEYIERLHEYVSSMYEPLVDNFVDSLWDWLDNGKDALDSFKEYASDTFRDIVSDMLRTIVLDKVVGTFSDDISALYEKYAEGKINENELMEQVAKFTEDLINRYGSNLPTLEGILAQVTGMFDKAGIDLRQPEDGGTTQSGRAGAYTALSQDQGTKLEGLFVSVQGHVSNIDSTFENVAERMNAAEGHLAKISENTASSAGALAKLQAMVERIIRDGIKTR